MLLSILYYVCYRAFLHRVNYVIKQSFVPVLGIGNFLIMTYSH